VSNQKNDSFRESGLSLAFGGLKSYQTAIFQPKHKIRNTNHQMNSPFGEFINFISFLRILSNKIHKVLQAHILLLPASCDWPLSGVRLQQLRGARPLATC
jgi:hypothetical protein